jgi:hypothetical protein
LAAYWLSREHLHDVIEEKEANRLLPVITMDRQSTSLKMRPETANGNAAETARTSNPA